MPFLESCFYGIQVTTDARWIFMDFRGTPLDSWEPSKTVSSYVVGLPCPLVVEYLKYTHLSAALPFIHTISMERRLTLLRDLSDVHNQCNIHGFTYLSLFHFFFNFLFLNTSICIVFMYIFLPCILFIHAIQTFHIQWLFIYLFILYHLQKVNWNC